MTSKLILILLVSFFSIQPIFSQEKEEKEKPKEDEKYIYSDAFKVTLTPRMVGTLGIIPGLGQAFIGNYKTGAFQMGLFVGLNGWQGFYASQKDYLDPDQRIVKFSFDDTVLAETLNYNKLLYMNSPLQLFGESDYDRLRRLWEEKAVAEINPLIKYGGKYERMNRNTYYSDELGNPILGSIFYSVYSGFRDSGGKGNTDEGIHDLAFAPFNPNILKNLKVILPILLIGAYSAIPSTSDTILVPKSLKNDGSLIGGTFLNGISPAIGEEAFFRGYLNQNLTQAYGREMGSVASGFIFTMAHAVNGEADFIGGFVGRGLLGVYLGLLHRDSGYDIRPGVAIHFWWNFFIGLSQLQYYKADPMYEKSQKDVHFMPVSYTVRF